MKRRALLFPQFFSRAVDRLGSNIGPGVRIAVGGRAALDYLPVYLASALGFFRDEGIDVTLQDLASTAKSLQALLGGSTDVVAGGYDGGVQMSIEGQLIKAVALLERWPPLALVVAPQLRTRSERSQPSRGEWLASPPQDRRLTALLTICWRETVWRRLISAQWVSV